VQRFGESRSIPTALGSARLDWGNVPHPETDSLFSHVTVGLVNADSKFLGQGPQQCS
jgi:hypothetical protein